MTEKRIVKVGIDKLAKPMTIEEARNWGERNIPRDLKAAGFRVSVFTSNPEINGGTFFRVNYSK
jgi:hypothetical protein